MAENESTCSLRFSVCNTQRVTKIIAETLQVSRMMQIVQAAPRQLSGPERLFAGSSTDRINMTPASVNFIKAVTKGPLLSSERQRAAEWERNVPIH